MKLSTLIVIGAGMAALAAAQETTQTRFDLQVRNDFFAGFILSLL